MQNPMMGTLAWCAQSGGRLTVAETEKMARNVAKLQAEIAFDELRTRLGVLSPSVVDLASLAQPDTALTRDADEFARSFYDDVLWNHAVRTYYFAALVAAHDGITFDRELLYAAAICHDVGANQEKAGHAHLQCFACNGGGLTRDHLLAKGHSDESAQRVGDAISSHMNIFVPATDYPVENTLTAVGATCDVLGSYVRRIHPHVVAKVVDRWPRTGVMEAFGAFLGLPHFPDSRTAALVKMGAFESKGEHPIEALLAERQHQGS